MTEPSSAMRRGARILRQLGALRLVMTALLIVAAMLLARFSWAMPFAQEAEGVLFDQRVVLTAPVAAQDTRIVQIVYDDDTLAMTGKRSPLDRTVLAKALKRIDAMGARAIAIDILIDQPQPEDPVLVAAFKSMKTPTWLAYASNATNADQITYGQKAFLDAFLTQLSPGNVRPTSIRLEAESDGVLRRWPARATGLPPAMPNALEPASEAFRHYAGSIAYRRAADRERGLFAAIPIQTFTADSLFANPETAAIFAAQIKGRYVLIGGHIQDMDLFQTPLVKAGERPSWGLDIFAHMLAQQLDGRMPRAIPHWAMWLAAVLVVVAATATALADVTPLGVAALLVVQIGAIGVLPFVLQGRGIDTFGLPMFGWGGGWILAFSAVGTAARAIGSEQRRFAQSALGKYLPRDIAAEILRDPDGLKLHGEKREIFVIFTDLEGFTKLSHSIAPETVATLLNRYLETLSNIVLDHGGTIDKFVGDAVVAFWGAPISRPDDGERAGRAAVALYRAGETFRRSVPEGVPPIGRTRVGMHHGEAIVGNFGGEGRIQYTALGDAMNAAARLESANKQLKSTVLVSRGAAELSGLDWYRPLGRVELRGRSTPIEVFEPVPDMNPTEREAFAKLVASGIQGDADARAQLSALSDMHPEDAALRNLLYRLEHQSEGGYYVLD